MTDVALCDRREAEAFGSGGPGGGAPGDVAVHRAEEPELPVITRRRGPPATPRGDGGRRGAFRRRLQTAGHRRGGGREGPGHEGALGVPGGVLEHELLVGGRAPEGRRSDNPPVYEEG